MLQSHEYFLLFVFYRLRQTFYEVSAELPQWLVVAHANLLNLNVFKWTLQYAAYDAQCIKDSIDWLAIELKQQLIFLCNHLINIEGHNNELLAQAADR